MRNPKPGYQKSLLYTERLTPVEYARADRYQTNSFIFLGVTAVASVTFGVTHEYSGIYADRISLLAIVVALASLAVAMFYDTRAIFIQKWTNLSAGWYVFDRAAKIVGCVKSCLGLGFLILAVFVLSMEF